MLKNSRFIFYFMLFFLLYALSCKISSEDTDLVQGRESLDVKPEVLQRLVFDIPADIQLSRSKVILGPDDLDWKHVVEMVFDGAEYHFIDFYHRRYIKYNNTDNKKRYIVNAFEGFGEIICMRSCKENVVILTKERIIFKINDDVIKYSNIFKLKSVDLSESYVAAISILNEESPILYVFDHDMKIICNKVINLKLLDVRLEDFLESDVEFINRNVYINFRMKNKFVIYRFGGSDLTFKGVSSWFSSGVFELRERVNEEIDDKYEYGVTMRGRVYPVVNRTKSLSGKYFGLVPLAGEYIKFLMKHNGKTEIVELTGGDYGGVLDWFPAGGDDGLEIYVLHSYKNELTRQFDKYLVHYW